MGNIQNLTHNSTLHQLKAEFTLNKRRGALESINCQVTLCLENSVNLRPACVHPLGHLRFANAPLPHFLGNLPRNYASYRLCFRSLVNAFLARKVVERRIRRRVYSNGICSVRRMEAFSPVNQSPATARMSLINMKRCRLSVADDTNPKCR
jgi:hypothetical protein